MGDDSTISAAEYARWVPMQEAIGRLPATWEQYTARRWIGTRLRSGEMNAVCRSAVIISMYFEDRNPTFFRIPKSAWENWQFDAYEHEWATGDCDLTQPSGVRNQHRDEFQCREVRLDPTMFSRFNTVTDDPSDDDPVEIVGRRPIPETLLEKWAALFREAYPEGNQSLARRSIDGMFPDKSATRSQLRRVIPPRPVGKPIDFKG